VQQVGPEHFGIVAIDCAKARSKWMLCDFYGKVLVPPTVVAHSQGHFAVAIAEVREAVSRHAVRDVVVAIERTGTYHLPVKRAFHAAGFECRVVHPLATKHFRQPAHPGNKTDDHDLSAIFLATVNGFGLIEQPLDPVWRQLRLLTRHRRDLVTKRSAICCQLREHWEAALPGLAACFNDFWMSPAALGIARFFSSPAAIAQAGVQGVRKALQAAGQRFQEPTLERLLAWARTAPIPDPDGAVHHRIALALDDDRLKKTLEIRDLEREIAGLMVQTPYILLWSVTGIHVVSAAELAAEMGPIQHDANARAITGRAGLFPARYQSDQVDQANGPLIRCANRRLRAALLMVADNLVKWNPHFRALAERWQILRNGPCQTRVKAASRFSRIAYHMLAGREVFHHPCCRQRDYILEKLLAFHRDHQTPPAEVVSDLKTAVVQLPKLEYPAEADALTKRFHRDRPTGRRGPQPIGDILVVVLAKLGVGTVKSMSSGDQGPG